MARRNVGGVEGSSEGNLSAELEDSSGTCGNDLAEVIRIIRVVADGRADVGCGVYLGQEYGR